MKNSIHMVIEGREKDIGVKVSRILPWAKKRMVGPFIFLDEMGPAFLHGNFDKMDVRPHPHIGLSTLTYLLEGSMLHRDSLGIVQEILPGEVNWMTAGRGIAHSERETEECRAQDRTLHGLQFWVALPKGKEDIAPTFEHYDSKNIPQINTESATIDIIGGTLYGKTSPLKAHSPLVFSVLRGHQQGNWTISSQEKYELAVYVVKGNITIEGTIYQPNHMVVFEIGSDIELEHSADAVLALIGGEPFPEPRFIWWNFVSSEQAKIDAAKQAWKERTFPQVPNETEFIPLPEA